MSVLSAMIAAVFWHASVTYTLAPAPGPARVEIEVPEPPIPVLVDSERVLAYELHVTSFAKDTIILRRLDVTSNTGRLASFDDGALSTMLQPIGSPMMHGMRSGDAARVAPGHRVVVFVWIPLPHGAAVPAAIDNRLSFATAGSPDSSGASTATAAVTCRQESVPVLPPPVPSGIWLAGDGPSNGSGHRRSLTALGGRTYISQRFAIDWQLVGPNGDTHRAGVSGNESFWGFGQPVLAVADGEVIDVVDSIPDNPPRVLPTVTLANIAGNYVILRIAPHRYAMYGHLQRGSVRVHAHERVRAGAVIAKLGNSGQATGPHLHFQVTDEPSVLGAEGVPWVLRAYDDLGPGSAFELTKHPTIPRRGALPGENDVVKW